ncbi:MAG TPA: hypothetical protein PLJ44_11675 [Victivallales bacterium]|nr:hypothetical protein [Victivallales bacterium]
MEQISFKKQDDKIIVTTYYNRKFANKARNLRGQWDSSSKAWIFDESVEEYVKQALIDIFGVTGEIPYETCSLLIKDFTAWEMRGEVELFGRTVARAFGRDSGAKLGDDIIWVSGSYHSGGSVKNWTTEVENGTFEIQNFPLERTKFDDVRKAVEEGWCEIKVNKKKRNREEIEAEIAALKSKLYELEEELKNCE